MHAHQERGERWTHPHWESKTTEKFRSELAQVSAHT